MNRHRAHKATALWRRYAAPLASTALGLALVMTGLHVPLMRSSAAAPREHTAAASTRGMIPGRRWLTLEESMPTAVPYVTSWEDAVPREAFAASIIIPTPAPTAIPVRTEVITYTVQPGDNVWLISQHFSISEDTLIWANDRLEMDPDMLSIGEDLAILPVNGVQHTVKAGDTLASIAKYYQATPDAIVDYAPNHLEADASLTPGMKLIVPGGEKPFIPRLVYTSAGAVTVNARPDPGHFIWPCSGAITQYYSEWHQAIDIGNVAGTPIYAADAGTVTLAGWWGNLGNAVRIDHGKGYVTIYGHMRALYVSAGDWVARGQQIGEMGSTGKSTGPHVHFMVYYYGGTVNPIRYLPSP